MFEIIRDLSPPTKKLGSSLEDLTGKRFGNLTVVAPDESKPYSYIVDCICGNQKTVIRYDLLSGHTKSCGCLPRGSTKHGKSDSKIYGIWCAMRARCLRPTSSGYRWYGARGVTICDEWSDFETFYADMGDPPNSESTLDRSNTLEGYSKANCRWLSITEQQRNKTSTVVYFFGGEHYSLANLAVVLGMKESTLAGRLYTGMTLEEAISGVRTTTTQTRKRVAGVKLYLERKDDDLNS